MVHDAAEWHLGHLVLLGQSDGGEACRTVKLEGTIGKSSTAPKKRHFETFIQLELSHVHVIFEVLPTTRPHINKTHHTFKQTCQHQQ